MSKITLFGSLCAAALTTLASIPSALAGPITTPPPPLNGSAPLHSSAVFAFADAGDTSNLNLVTPSGFPNPVFTNNVGTPFGTTVDLGALSGPVVFGLDNLTTSTSFLATDPDSDGNYHAKYSPSCSDTASCDAAYSSTYGVGSLQAPVATAIADLFSSGASSFIFIGWEDLTSEQGSDFDYNDLIFAFSNVNNPESVPEPSTLLLVGGSLLGLGLLRRRKKVFGAGAKA